MVRIEKQPNLYSMVFNPMHFVFSTDSIEPFDIKIIVEGESTVLTVLPYKVSDKLYYGDLYIQDVIQTYFDTETIITEYNDIVAELENFIINYSVEFGAQRVDLHAVYGGIDDELYMQLNDVGQDIFDFRLCNYSSQFLFTTRTNDTILRLRELELFPLAFIHPGKEISFKSENNRIIKSDVFKQGTACVMDLVSIRNEFLSQYGEVPYHVSVLVGNVKVIDIEILASQLTEYTSILRFRNSLGGFESVELTGKPIFNPKFAEENKYKVRNSFGLFETRRDRLELENIFTIDSGYKTKEELDHLMDAICSDYQLLIDQKGKARRCSVTTEQPKYSDPLISPISIQLKITLTTSSLYRMPPLPAMNSWILDTGIWNDFGIWKDNALWID